MKKGICLVCSLLLCSQTVFGQDELVGNQKEAQKLETIEQKKSVQSEVMPKEEILNVLGVKDGQVIESVNESVKVGMTQAEVAKLLCYEIGKGPIYLPEKEGELDPFIGRLVMEYVWGDLKIDEKALITRAEWERLWKRTKQFKNDAMSLQKELDKAPQNIKQKLQQYDKEAYKKVPYEKKSLGDLKMSGQKVSLESHCYDLYKCLGTNYVSLEALMNMGFEKEEKEEGIYLVFKGEKWGENAVPSLSEKDVYLNAKPIYIGHERTYTLMSENHLLVPIRALEAYFNLEVAEGEILLLPQVTSMSEWIASDEKSLRNKSEETVHLSYSHFYWNGKEMLEKKEEQTLLPGEKLLKPIELYNLKKAYYVTTVIHKLETENIKIEQQGELVKNAVEVLKAYEKLVAPAPKPMPKPVSKPTISKQEASKGLFPASLIMGTMKRNAGGFKKGTQVEIWAAEGGSYYWAKGANGKKVKIPWNSVSIPKNPATSTDKPTKAQIEHFINKEGLSSQTRYLIWTDLYRQQTYIFKGKQNEWELIRTMVCSTGNNVTPTPRGQFELMNRVPYFGVNKGYRCKNAFQIFGDYLYHSILYDVTGTRIIGGYKQLGNRASHGCIRLKPEDSLWLYNTMQTGTRVWIN